MNFKRSLGVALGALFSFSGALHAVRVMVLDGTPVVVRVKADLRSDRVEPGDRVDFEVARPVTARGLVVIPEGAIAWGAVQSVKKDKEIKFDVQGLRLPNLQEIKLRSVREKTKSARKDQIKLETDLGTFVGAFRGTEFMAYVDEVAVVEVEGAAPVTPAAPVPAAPTPAPAVTTPATTAPVVTRPAQASAPAVTPQPTAPPAAPQPTAPAAVERVTVECFSVPSGAEILINGDFYGHTPSILMLTTTSHRIDIMLSGYKTHSQPLNLTPQTRFNTIRAILEKKE